MIFDVNWNNISAEVFQNVTENADIIIFGMSPRNLEIFELIDIKNVLCIYDNNPDKWGKNDAGIEIKKPETCTEAIIVTAVEDYGHLIPQFERLGYKKIYFFMRDTIYESRYKVYIEKFVRSTEHYVTIRADRKIKYMHIFSDNKFFLPTVDLIEKYFDMKEHGFIIYAINRSNWNDKYFNWKKIWELSKRYGNVLIVDDECNFNNVDNEKVLGEHRECLNECNKIIFHGEWLSEQIRMFFSQKENLELVKKKGLWLIWSGSVGTDACNRDNINQVLKYCRIVVAGTDFEKQQLLHNFEMKNSYWLKNLVSYTQIVERPVKIRGGKNVFIGHSCYQKNENIEALRALLKYKGEIDIYCIVSYGTQEYIDEVVTEGKKLYGDRFHPVNTFLEYSEYVELLNNMDVVFYAMETAASYTTLQIMFWLKKKVYLKKETGIDVMTKECGYQVYNFYDIEKASIEDFFFVNDALIEHNYEVSKKEFDFEVKIAQWREIFEC